MTTARAILPLTGPDGTFDKGAIITGVPAETLAIWVEHGAAEYIGGEAAAPMPPASDLEREHPGTGSPMEGVEVEPGKAYELSADGTTRELTPEETAALQAQGDVELEPATTDATAAATGETADAPPPEAPTPPIETGTAGPPETGTTKPRKPRAKKAQG